MAESLKTMTLAERLKKADYLSRELSEHFRQASLPKLTALVRASREYDPAVVSDQQILDHARAVLEADDFAHNIYTELRAYLDSIRKDIEPLLVADPSAQRSDDSGTFGIEIEEE